MIKHIENSNSNNLCLHLSSKHQQEIKGCETVIKSIISINYVRIIDEHMHASFYI
jgi:hypothetical protein